jgi:hypothetical protein
MQAQALSHDVLKMRILQRSEVFSSGTSGMRVISRPSIRRMTFFTLEAASAMGVEMPAHVGSG